MRVTIVGGGLAGLIAGIRLAERGCAVEVYEMDQRWGGKAGAKKHKSDVDEHGYHIFPMWYRNIWEITHELGIEGNFRDCEEFQQLNPGGFPRFLSFRNITSWRYVWRNLTAGVLPFSQAVLFFYAALDLMSQRYRYRSQLDQVTVSGFLRSRFYRTELISSQFEELMLKGISVPTYEVSAMSMRNVMRFWIRAPEPMHRILRGDLDSLWVTPLVDRLTSLGATFHLGHRLTRIACHDKHVARLHFKTVSGEELVREVDRVLLAIPCEKVVPLIDDTLYVRAPRLAQIRYLRARPMAALNVYFAKRITGVPKDHANLLGSQFGLSFIDVSQTWPNRGATELNLIASDFTSLEGLSDEAAVAELLRDSRRYIPFERADIVRYDFQSHMTEPLFMNNVGGWAFRPNAQTEIPNLFVAGDYCRSVIDLVCMEGAVSTGLLAAEAIRRDGNLPRPIKVLEPKTYPTWLMVIGRIVLLPIAAVAKLATMLTPGRSRAAKN